MCPKVSSHVWEKMWENLAIQGISRQFQLYILDNKNPISATNPQLSYEKGGDDNQSSPLLCT